jgi:hypothetical protein
MTTATLPLLPSLHLTHLEQRGIQVLKREDGARRERGHRRRLVRRQVAKERAQRRPHRRGVQPGQARVQLHRLARVPVFFHLNATLWGKVDPQAGPRRCDPKVEFRLVRNEGLHQKSGDGPGHARAQGDDLAQARRDEGFRAGQVDADGQEVVLAALAKQGVRLSFFFDVFFWGVG